MKNLTRSTFILAFCLVSFQSWGQFGCDLNDKGVWVTPGTNNPCVNSIITAVPFLRIVPDARSGGMGDVGIGLSPDANSMHHNASKLAFVNKDLSIAATYTPWLRALGIPDVYLAYLAGYKQIDKLSTVGFSLRYFSLGTINFTDENGGSLGDGKPNEFEVAVAYARQLSPKFAVSLTPKFIFSNLAAGQTVNNVDIEPGIAGAADFAFTYKTGIKLNDKKTDLMVGLGVSNLGTKISYTKSINKDFIPTNLGLGAGWTINADEFNAITFALDINKLMVPTPCLDDPNTPNINECDTDGDDIPDYKQESMFSGVLGSFSDAPGGFSEEMRELSYSMGVEYWYDQQFAVRAGYYSENQTKGNRKFFTVGLGLKYNIFALNFSYLVPTTQQRNPLDNTLRFTLMFDFGAFDYEDNN
jgi:Type IX secretion system protein PorV